MAARKSRRDSYSLLAARFMQKIHTEWRDSFTGYELGIITWLMCYSIATGEPDIRLELHHFMNRRDHATIKGFKPFLGFDLNSETRDIWNAISGARNRLIDLGILKAWEDRLDSSGRWTTYIVDLSWTPERVNV